LYIYDLPDEILALTLDVDTTGMGDRKKAIYSCFTHYFKKRNTKGVHKRCDLVLFNPTPNNFFVILFELKSSDPDMDDAICQLRNSQLYIDYVINVLREFYELKQPIVIHKIIGTTRIRKSTTRVQKERMAKICREKQLLNDNNVKEIKITSKGSKKGAVKFTDLI
ncbi:hypothetical protein J9231_07140, partial [Providencia rettgeri]|uniref:hypothetical protein n=1 Tax=Providencia rettgeri TaxID=587 RepID=UPI001B391A72